MPTRDRLFTAYALSGRDRPRVRINFISSADGAVTLSGHSGGLGGPTDRRLMRVLRTMADVVLVAAGTVRAEGYGGLGQKAEDIAWRREHKLDPELRLAVVTNSLDLEPDSPVFTQADNRPMIITNANSPADRRAALAEVADIINCGEQSVDLTAVVDELAARGLTQIMCEGGPHLFGSLLEADLVDEVCLTISPRFLAGPTGRIAASATEVDRRFDLASVLTDDEGFVFLRYTRRR